MGNSTLKVEHSLPQADKLIPSKVQLGVGVLLIGSICAARKVWQHVKLAMLADTELYDLILKMPPFPVGGNLDNSWSVDISAPNISNKVDVSLQVPDFWTASRKHRKNVAFCGQYNAGKTKLISLLTGRKYPHSSVLHTDGISAVYEEARNMMLFDSAGTDVVADSHLGDVEADFGLELMERFCSKVLMCTSSIFVYVIAKYTRAEMRRVWGHLKELESSDRADMTVVYNLRAAMSEVEAKRQFQKIIDGFKAHFMRSGQDGWSFQSKHDNVAVHHWALVNDDMPWGKQCNKSQMSSIWGHLETLNAAQTQDQSPCNMFLAAMGQVMPTFVVSCASAVRVDYADISQTESTPTRRVRKVGDCHRYVSFGRFIFGLPNGGLSMRNALQPAANRRLEERDQGYEPLVCVQRTQSEPRLHYVMVDVPNCVDMHKVGADDEVPPGVGKVTVEKDVQNGQFFCTRVTITKVPSSKGRKDATVEKFASFAFGEQQGEFIFEYPPNPRRSSVIEGCDNSPVTHSVKYQSHSVKEGLLTLIMEETVPKSSSLSDAF